MAGGVRYDLLYLREHEEFSIFLTLFLFLLLFFGCVVVHGVSFTIMDVQTPWLHSAFSVIGGNSPSFA